MNYLAHSLLSGNKEEIIIGNFISDIVRKNEYDQIHDRFNIGIELHKKIDQFTDDHESVKNIIRLLRPHHKKYAPVVTDILMDYILGKNWDKYCDGDVQSFANKKYEVIGKNINEFPQRVIPIIEKMLNGNFLIKYTTIEGLTFTFEKIQEAARFPSDFIQAIQDLEENYDEIECEFNIFFPEIVLYTKDFRK